METWDALNDKDKEEIATQNDLASMVTGNIQIEAAYYRENSSTEYLDIFKKFKIHSSQHQELYARFVGLKII